MRQLRKGIGSRGVAHKWCLERMELEMLHNHLQLVRRSLCQLAAGPLKAGRFTGVASRHACLQRLMPAGLLGQGVQRQAAAGLPEAAALWPPVRGRAQRGAWELPRVSAGELSF